MDETRWDRIRREQLARKAHANRPLSEVEEADEHERHSPAYVMGCGLCPVPSNAPAPKAEAE